MLAHESPYLSDICLFGCHRVTNAGVIALASCSHQLVFIDVGKCHDITDGALIAYADACRNISDPVNIFEVNDGCSLRKISFAFCYLITDIGISALGRSCRLLSDINISGCTNISDVGIAALAECCPLLTDINLAGCEEITDIGI